MSRLDLMSFELDLATPMVGMARFFILEFSRLFSWESFCEKSLFFFLLSFFLTILYITHSSLEKYLGKFYKICSKVPLIAKTFSRKKKLFKKYVQAPFFAKM